MRLCARLVAPLNDNGFLRNLSSYRVLCVPRRLGKGPLWDWRVSKEPKGNSGLGKGGLGETSAPGQCPLETLNGQWLHMPPPKPELEMFLCAGNIYSLTYSFIQPVSTSLLLRARVCARSWERDGGTDTSIIPVLMFCFVCNHLWKAVWQGGCPRRLKPSHSPQSTEVLFWPFFRGWNLPKDIQVSESGSKPLLLLGASLAPATATALRAAKSSGL